MVIKINSFTSGERDYAHDAIDARRWFCVCFNLSMCIVLTHWSFCVKKPLEYNDDQCLLFGKTPQITVEWHLAKIVLVRMFTKCVAVLVSQIWPVKTGNMCTLSLYSYMCIETPYDPIIGLWLVCVTGSPIWENSTTIYD